MTRQSGKVLTLSNINLLYTIKYVYIAAKFVIKTYIIDLVNPRFVAKSNYTGNLRKVEFSLAIFIIC